MTDKHTDLCERLEHVAIHGDCRWRDTLREAKTIIQQQAARIQQQALDYVSLFDQCSGHLARIAELEKERDALKADAQTWRSLLAMLIHEINKGRHRGPYNRPENAPLHGHAKVGIWDNDNGALSGTQCAWCAVWNEARAALQAEKEAK